MTPAVAPAGRDARQVPPEVLRKIREVEIKARILADEGFLGSYRSVFRGSGLEFEEVREYQPGDEIRTIDWNVTARTGVPYVKKYREERELSVVLAVDVSSSSWFGSATSKRDLAASVAALLAVSAMHVNDRVALVLFADRIVDYHAPRRGHDHLVRLIRAVLFEQPGRSRTDIAGVADFLRAVMKKRSVVFLISDFLDEGWEAGVRLLGRKHDVIAVSTTDPREAALPSVGVVGLEDAESGATRVIDTGDRALRDAYAAAAAARRAERTRAFGRLGVDSVELWTDRPYIPALIALFNTRIHRH